MKADRLSNPILTAQSARRRRRLTLMAFLLGLGSVVLSLVIVEINHLLKNLEIAQQEYLRQTSNEVSMLAAARRCRREHDRRQAVDHDCRFLGPYRRHIGTAIRMNTFSSSITLTPR